MKHPVRVAIVMYLLAGFSLAMPALSLELPKNRPILEIAGIIQERNKGDVAVFDRDMLEAMGLQTIVTSTPWDEGQVRYEGVRLSKLMEHVKAQGRHVKAIALNDYESVLPVEDFNKYEVILALKRNGEYMPVREKGPLFIVYPFDSNPALKAQVFYARSVWQVRRLEVEP